MRAGLACFWVKGDGKSHRVAIISESGRREFTFPAGPEWQRVRFDFPEERDFDPAQFLCLILAASAQPGHFAFQIDEKALSPEVTPPFERTFFSGDSKWKFPVRYRSLPRRTHAPRPPYAGGQGLSEFCSSCRLGSHQMERPRAASPDHESSCLDKLQSVTSWGSSRRKVWSRRSSTWPART